MADTATAVPTLKALYYDEIQARLKDELGLENIMQVPKLEKISVNMGVGEAALNRRALEGAMEDLATITGQKPSVTRAKKRRTSKRVPARARVLPWSNCWSS